MQSQTAAAVKAYQVVVQRLASETLPADREYLFAAKSLRGTHSLNDLPSGLVIVFVCLTTLRGDISAVDFVV